MLCIALAVAVVSALLMHVHALSCHAGCFVTAAPLRDGRAKLQTTSTAVDADSRIATRRVTFIVCVVSEVMFKAAFVQQSAMFGHSTCGTKVNGVWSFSVVLSRVCDVESMRGPSRPRIRSHGKFSG